MTAECARSCAAAGRACACARKNATGATRARREMSAIQTAAAAQARSERAVAGRARRQWRACMHRARAAADAIKQPQDVTALMATRRHAQASAARVGRQIAQSASVRAALCQARAAIRSNWRAPSALMVCSCGSDAQQEKRAPARANGRRVAAPLGRDEQAVRRGRRRSRDARDEVADRAPLREREEEGRHGSRELN